MKRDYGTVTKAYLIIDFRKKTMRFVTEVKFGEPSLTTNHNKALPYWKKSEASIAMASIVTRLRSQGEDLRPNDFAIAPIQITTTVKRIFVTGKQKKRIR